MPTGVIGYGATVDLPKRLHHEFRTEPITAKRAGGAATGTTGDRNILLSPGAGFQGPATFEYHIKGTQTILAPTLGTNGLDIGMDQTDNDGVELTCGITARSPLAFVVGTDKAFFLEVRAVIADVSGVGPFLIGFRKAEAYQADWNAYDELASIGLFGVDIYTSTILNNAATVDTDTTDNAADATALTLRVNVSAAGAVTYRVNGSAPTTTVAFSFDASEVVVPFVYFLHDADVAGTVELIHFDCGYS
jgi:hypothetical protein